jgi:hypothetical protein
VTLTASAEAGSAFSGWSGACSGAGDCHVVVTETTNVTATFILIQHQLSVDIDGEGSGSVFSDPSGIDCPGDCSAGYAHGSVVTLTAVPEPGSVFSGWSGACSGMMECIITMDADMSVAASFDIVEFPVFLPMLVH